MQGITIDIQKVVEELLAEKYGCTEVSTPENRRFYVEDTTTNRSWDNRHHLIDLEDKIGYEDATLIIHQMSSGGSSDVTLDNNEVLALLAELLRWYIECRQKIADAMESRSTESELDDHPF